MSLRVIVIMIVIVLVLLPAPSLLSLLFDPIPISHSPT